MWSFTRPLVSVKIYVKLRSGTGPTLRLKPQPFHSWCFYFALGAQGVLFTMVAIHWPGISFASTPPKVGGVWFQSLIEAKQVASPVFLTVGLQKTTCATQLGFYWFLMIFMKRFGCVGSNVFLRATPGIDLLRLWSRCCEANALGQVLLLDHNQISGSWGEVKHSYVSGRCLREAVRLCLAGYFCWCYLQGTAKLLDKNRLVTGSGYPQVLKPKLPKFRGWRTQYFQLSGAPKTNFGKGISFLAFRKRDGQGHGLKRREKVNLASGNFKKNEAKEALPNAPCEIRTPAWGQSPAVKA